MLTNQGNGWSDTLSYTYDCKGNIETISENGEQKAKYYYDELNQLVREDNVWLGKTIAYTYDNGGNIQLVEEYVYTSGALDSLTAENSYTYLYGDSNWKDKLTSFNGNEITYDEIGNPLTCNGYTFTWQNGRELAAISTSDLSVSYKYNADGIRTRKTVNGVTTNYTLEGTNVVYETNGTDSIWYSYDADGALVSMTLNGTTYYYVTNLQGDITALTDSEGNIVVEYVYDSWGKLITISGTLADTVGVKNPYRYRSYRYDTETGLYYLQSRYYNPEIKRFINADIYVDTGDTTLSTNMFAYCENNPIVYIDSNGQWIQMAVSALVGGLVGVALYFAGQLLSALIDSVDGWLKTGKWPKFSVKIKGGQILAAFLSGAISGALSSSYYRKVTLQIANGLVSYIGTRASGGTILESVIATIISVISSDSGTGKPFRKLNKNLIKKLKTRDTKVIAKGITYYLKNTSKLYNRYLKDLVKSNVRDWLKTFGVYNLIKRI